MWPWNFFIPSPFLLYPLYLDFFGAPSCPPKLARQGRAGDGGSFRRRRLTPDSCFSDVKCQGMPLLQASGLGSGFQMQCRALLRSLGLIPRRLRRILKNRAKKENTNSCIRKNPVIANSRCFKIRYPAACGGEFSFKLGKSRLERKVRV